MVDGKSYANLAITLCAQGFSGSGVGQNSLHSSSQLEVLGYQIKMKFKCELAPSLCSTDGDDCFP